MRAARSHRGLMPKRTDIHKILIIGAGPIVIGQACEFDYSGTQACKVLRRGGLSRSSLVNSNPATIMTDPEMADRTYIEPITPESSSRSSPGAARRRPADARRPDRAERGRRARRVGRLERHGGELIGASLRRSARPRTAAGSRSDGRDRPGRAAERARAHPRRGPALRDEIGLPCVRAELHAGRRRGRDRATTARSSTGGRLRARAQPGRTRSWSRRRSSAGKSTRWR